MRTQRLQARLVLREELEAQATPKTQEREELETQEEAEAYHTRREGPHVQKEDRGLDSSPLPEASIIANPAELLTEEEKRGDGAGRRSGMEEEEGSVWSGPRRLLARCGIGPGLACGRRSGFACGLRPGLVCGSEMAARAGLHRRHALHGEEEEAPPAQLRLMRCTHRFWW